MKNRNQPAMPLNHQPFSTEYKTSADAQAIAMGFVPDPNEFKGLTKLEHFAALVIPPQEVLIETLKQEFPDGFTPAQYIEVAVGYKIQEASATLEALDKDKGES